MAIPQLFTLPETKNRVFGLDLLRAFAIVTVLLVHGAQWVSPKFTFYFNYVLRFDGVSIFFVLSGFLIGGILIRTLETKPHTLGTLWNFWVKRWVRTVPPYMLALLLVIAIDVWWWKGTPASYAPFSLFIQNLNWPHPPQWQEAWSLAVEEWFYLLSAPSVFALAALRLKPSRAVLVASVVFIVFSTLHRYQYFLEFAPQTKPEWEEPLRKVVLMRLDALMFGVLAAYFSYYHNAAWLRYKLPLFIIGLVWLYMQTMPGGQGQYGLFGSVFYFTCVGVATVMMLPFLSTWQTNSGPVAAAVTHVALISYSMYLLHNTIIQGGIVQPLVRVLPVSQAVRNASGLGLYLGLTLLASTLMYKYFELPVMALRNRLTEPGQKHPAAN